MSYILYYAPDNASLIIRLALEEMGLPYETVLVNRAAREQQSAAYRHKVPSGKIPALETPDGIVFETAAILLWLCERHGQLAPIAQGTKRAQFLKWLFFTSNTLHADLRSLFYPEAYAPKDMIAEFHAGTTKRVAHNLALLEAHVSEWSHENDLNVIDIYIAVILRWVALYPINGHEWFDLAEYPNLAQIAERLESRKA